MSQLEYPVQPPTDNGHLISPACRVDRQLFAQISPRKAGEPAPWSISIRAVGFHIRAQRAEDVEITCPARPLVEAELDRDREDFLRILNFWRHGRKRCRPAQHLQRFTIECGKA